MLIRLLLIFGVVVGLIGCAKEGDLATPNNSDSHFISLDGNDGLDNGGVTDPDDNDDDDDGEDEGIDKGKGGNSENGGSDDENDELSNN